MIYLFTEKFASSPKNLSSKANTKARTGHDSDSFAHSIVFKQSEANKCPGDTFSLNNQNMTRRNGFKRHSISNYLKKLGVGGNNTTSSNVVAKDDYPIDNPKYLVYYALTRV